MAKLVNEVHLAGRAGKDAVRSGNGPWRFSLAQGGGKKKGSEERWPTDWFNVVCWENTCPDGAEVRKGAEVEVWGRLKPNEWTKDGVKHYGMDVVAETVQVGESAKPEVHREPTTDYVREPITDDDIPF